MRGFTLIEILIATGLAMILGLITAELLKANMKGAAAIRNISGESNASNTISMALQETSKCDSRVVPVMEMPAGSGTYVAMDNGTFMSRLMALSASQDPEPDLLPLTDPKYLPPIPLKILNNVKPPATPAQELVLMQEGQADGPNDVRVHLILPQITSTDAQGNMYVSAKIRVTERPKKLLNPDGTVKAPTNGTAYSTYRRANSLIDVPINMILTPTALNPITQCSSKGGTGTTGLTLDKFSVYVVDVGGGSSAVLPTALVAGNAAFAVAQTVASGSDNTKMTVSIDPPFTGSGTPPPTNVSVSVSGGGFNNISVVAMGIPYDKSQRNYKFIDIGTVDTTGKKAYFKYPFADFSTGFSTGTPSVKVMLQPNHIEWSHSCSVKCGTNGSWWATAKPANLTPAGFDLNLTWGIDSGSAQAYSATYVAVGDPYPGDWEYPVVNMGMVDGSLLSLYANHAVDIPAPGFANPHNEGPRMIASMASFVRNSCYNNDGKITTDLGQVGSRGGQVIIPGGTTCGGGYQVTTAQYLSVGE